MERVDCIVAGAGVVGLAVARALAQQGLETLVLEREPAIGTGSSSRNSEVLHAGIYYPPGSLKAKLCVRGNALLRAYCEQRGLGWRACGKLIVASTTAQNAALEALRTTGEANGVPGLQLLDASGARQLEAQLHCTAALLSPSTGIVDSHGLMLSLQGEAEAAGALFAFGAEVSAARSTRDGLELQIGGAQPMEIACSLLVNCAGLGAQALAAAIEGMHGEHIPPLHLAKGSYFSLGGRAPFSRLIYPVPEPGGLGVHLTLDLGGQARFGPDVEWVDGIDYRVDAARAQGFYAAIRRYWPALPDGALQPAYAGIRPKLSGPGEAAADFVIQTEAEHGVPGLVHLFGIESPGLTASLALAEEIAARCT